MTESIAARNASTQTAEASAGRKVRTIYLSPQGRTFSQRMAEELSKEENLVFLCGHYEGIDERALAEIVTDTVSMGDFVLTGGELAAMMMIDAISRLIPGVLHNDFPPRTSPFQGIFWSIRSTPGRKSGTESGCRRSFYQATTKNPGMAAEKGGRADKGKTPRPLCRIPGASDLQGNAYEE